MHSAPSVSFPVGRSRVAAALLAGLWAAGLLGIALWRLQAAADDGLLSGMLAASVATGLLGVWYWRRSPVGLLRWQEGQWLFAPAPLDGGDAQVLTRLRCVLDLQGAMLLQVRAQEPGAPSWLWLAGRDDPGRWRALRRAVHGRMPRADAAPAPLARRGRAA